MYHAKSKEERNRVYTSPHWLFEQIQSSIEWLRQDFCIVQAKEELGQEIESRYSSSFVAEGASEFAAKRAVISSQGSYLEARRDLMEQDRYGLTIRREMVGRIIADSRETLEAASVRLYPGLEGDALADVVRESLEDYAERCGMTAYLPPIERGGPSGGASTPGGL